MTNEPGTRPYLTMSEAMDACGVSKSTMKRRMKKGDFPHAVQDDPTNPQSPWRIPVTDLLAVGMNPGRPTPPDPVDPVPATTRAETVTLPKSEYEEIQATLARAAAQQQVIVAMEATVASMEANLVDLRQAASLYEKQLEMVQPKKELGTSPAEPDEHVVDLRALTPWQTYRMARAAKKQERKNQKTVKASIES